MSTTRTTRNIVWAVVVLFVACVGSVTLLQLFAPEDANATITALLASMPATVAVLANLVRTDQVSGVVEQVRQDTQDLTNGLLDAKVRSGVAQVLAPELVDDDIADQLEHDRARIDAAHGDPDTLPGNGVPDPRPSLRDPGRPGL
jgi:hypothetical protein